MTLSFDTDGAKARTKQMLEALNEGDLDLFLSTYSDNIRFTIPVRAQTTSDVGMESGDGKAALRDCLAHMHRLGAPFRLLDLFGTLSSRSLVLEDALGNRLLMSVETDATGLTSNIFAMRTRTGVQIAA